MRHTVSELVLDNGAKGLLIHIPDATVLSYEINFRAGDYLVPPEKWETAHLMEHVLLGANELLPTARAFNAELEKNGAYSNASCGSYDITYEAECADFEWDRVLSLMLTAICKPLFLEEEFRSEFGNVREELTARSNNHFRHLGLALRNAFGFKVLTDQQRLQLMDNVVLEDIRTHYANTHTTSNMRFVIAGNLTAERKRAIKAVLGNTELPKGNGRFVLPPEHPILLDEPLYIHNATVDNMYFYLDTFMQRRLDDAEADALNLSNIMLTETFYSRIFGQARDKGLVYHISSGHGYARDSSNWWIGSQVLPKNSEALMQIVTKELDAVRKGSFADAEVIAAKQYALGRYQRGAQTVGGTAGGYSGRYYYDDVIEDYYKVPERIAAVTKEAIAETMGAFFADNTWGIGILGNAGNEFVAARHAQVRHLWQQ